MAVLLVESRGLAAEELAHSRRPHNRMSSSSASGLCARPVFERRRICWAGCLGLIMYEQWSATGADHAPHRPEQRTASGLGTYPSSVDEHVSSEPDAGGHVVWHGTRHGNSYVDPRPPQTIVVPHGGGIPTALQEDASNPANYGRDYMLGMPVLLGPTAEILKTRPARCMWSKPCAGLWDERFPHVIMGSAVLLQDLPHRPGPTVIWGQLGPGVPHLPVEGEAAQVS